MPPGAGWRWPIKGAEHPIPEDLRMLISLMVKRFDPTMDVAPRTDTFAVPVPDGERWTALDLLDYVYLNFDSSLRYPRHSICSRGICMGCAARINGNVGRLCNYVVETDDDIFLNRSMRSVWSSTWFQGSPLLRIRASRRQEQHGARAVSKRPRAGAHRQPDAPFWRCHLVFMIAAMLRWKASRRSFSSYRRRPDWPPPGAVRRAAHRRRQSDPSTPGWRA